MGEVLHGSLLQLLLENCDFLIIDISQSSVATRLRCGGIFKYELVENLPMSQPVKEFWKSVNIRGSYGQEFGVLFFSETQCIIVRTGNTKDSFTVKTLYECCINNIKITSNNLKNDVISKILYEWMLLNLCAILKYIYAVSFNTE